jgi:AcrR family transcriptional regulator
MEDHMARPKRIDQTDLLNEIKTAAWQQIAQNGAAALSLRAIARALHITAPAIYNYYPSRDDLVTALIVDAYTAMGDAQFAALETVPAGAHAARLMALGMAYRQWAVTFPHSYQLIFGTPIPGYHASEEITGPAASRSLMPLIGSLAAAYADGRLIVPEESKFSDALRGQLDVWLRFVSVGDIAVLYAALVVWSRVHGLVSLEIGHQYPPCIEDTAALYQLQMERLIADHLIPGSMAPQGENHA